MIDLNNKIKEAMKSHDKVALKIYKEIKSQKLLLETAKNAKEYNDSSEIKILQNMAKQRMETKQYAIKLLRQDLIDETNNELTMIESLIPAAPSSEEIDNFVSELIPDMDGELKIGEIIKIVKSKYPSADGKLISEIVKNYM